jgi:hypothetical protein
MIEGDLVRKDRFAGAWPTLDDVGRARDKPAIKDGIQSLDPTRNARELLHLFTPAENADAVFILIQLSLFAQLKMRPYDNVRLLRRDLFCEGYRARERRRQACRHTGCLGVSTPEIAKFVGLVKAVQA